MRLPALPAFPELPQPDFSKLPNLSRATVAGISVAICGNVLISLALNCQKLAHRRLELEREQNGVDLEHNGSKSISNGEPRIDEEEESEHTLRPAAMSPARHDYDRTPRAAPMSAAAVNETEPLLATHTDEVPTYDALESLPTSNATPKRPSLLSRLSPWRRRAKKTASDIDTAHVGATHSLMPVDVVTVRPISPVRESEEEEQVKSPDDTVDANESDYLRSKLWYVPALSAFVPRIHLRPQVAWVSAHERRRDGELHLIRICSRVGGRTSGHSEWRKRC